MVFSARGFRILGKPLNYIISMTFHLMHSSKANLVWLHLLKRKTEKKERIWVHTLREMTSTKCSFPTSPWLDRHLVYKIIQMWWKWKRNYRSNRKKSTSAEHDTLKNFEAGILDLKTMAYGKMTHFLFVNLLLAAVLWTTGKKPGRS